MWGGKSCVKAISEPHVRWVVPVASSTTEPIASGNDDGLKMWTRRPSFSHRRNSLAAKPTATSTNCQ